MVLSLLINILLKSITGKRVKTNIFKPQTVRNYQIFSYIEGRTQDFHLYLVDDGIIAEDVTHW